MFSILQAKKGVGRRNLRRFARNSPAAGGGRPSSRALRAAAVVFCFLWMAGYLLKVCLFGGRILWKTIPGPRVRHIEVHAGETITAPLLLDFLQIEEGMPMFTRSRSLLGGIFSCDIREKQRHLLEKAPTLASVTITRRMPDTIVISVTERIPVARLEKYPIGIDRNGILFVRRRGIDGVPAIRGERMVSTKLGHKFSEGILADAALELVDCLMSGESAIPVMELESIDISKTDYLECRFTNRCHAKLAWKEMGEGTSFGRRCLIAQLNGLAGAMASPRAQSHSSFDVTIPGHCFAN